MATARKTKPAEAAGKQRTRERQAKEASVPIFQKVQDCPAPSLPADLQDAVRAARRRFLYAAKKISRTRLALAINAFQQNCLAHASRVLAPLLEGWQELMILLAEDYFSNKMRVMAEKQYSSGAIAWASSQTRLALDEAFGTTWFSTPEPKLKAVSREVDSWLRKIDERSFVPPKSISGSLPALVDTKAWTTIFLQQAQWRGHGWLATWLPPSTAAFTHYVDNPLEPLTDEVQTGVVGDITLYLFDGIEQALKDAVDLALVEQACFKSDAPESLKFVRRGKRLVAEPCGNMETAVANTYKALLPYMVQAQSIVRSSGRSITASELKSNFKNTYFVKALDVDDWELLIEQFSQKRPAGCRNLTLALLSRRTGKSIETVATYARPGRKRKKTAHP